MCTASCPAVGCRPTARFGGVPARGSSCAVRVFSRLFRRRFLEALQAGTAGPASCGSSASARRWPTARPSGGGWRQCASASGWSTPSGPSPDLQRCWPTCRAYARRVAISNSRLLALDERGAFRWKDYRAKGDTRHKAMTLSPRSSCAASCCMCCPVGSTASGVRASATAGVGSAWLRRVSCSVEPVPQQPRHPRCRARPGRCEARPTFVCRHCGRAIAIVPLLAREPSIRAPPRVVRSDCFICTVDDSRHPMAGGQALRPYARRPRPGAAIAPELSPRRASSSAVSDSHSSSDIVVEHNEAGRAAPIAIATQPSTTAPWRAPRFPSRLAVRRLPLGWCR